MQNWKCNVCGTEYMLYDVDCPPDKDLAKCNKKDCKGTLKYKEHGGESWTSTIEEN